jgi:hypothetical protein
MKKRKSKRAPRARRARPLLMVAASLGLAAVAAGCGPSPPTCGNAAYCGPPPDLAINLNACGPPFNPCDGGTR